MSVFRIYVEKKPEFAVEAQSVLSDIKTALRLNISGVRILNRYDADKLSEEDFNAAISTVFSEPAVDVVYDELPQVAESDRVFAVEYLPGQFDQRADSCEQCIQILRQGERCRVRNARVYIISGVITELQSALASARRVFDIIDEPEERPDSEDAYVLKEVDGTVDIENVNFSYVPDVKLIEDFNLHVRAGERTAIVGPTGCGKTTMINLLMRFYDADSGKISISGRPIKDCTRNSMRSMYGMVLQETWLKTATIRDNIRYGRPDATEEEVIAAAKSAHCHGFIKRLPQGYDTVISDAFSTLSQGQKQILCIARVMLSLPPMLILDEATSSIDTRTEIIVQRAFAKMMKGRTSFIIAHRLSTIKEAENIIVMRSGHIVEQGTHESLIAKGGFYSELYNSQFAAD